MSDTGQFHLGDILSITNEHLVSPDLMGGVYKILDYMTGDSLYTHQLLRARRECAPYLFEAMPFLHDINESVKDKDKDWWKANWESWRDEQCEKYGTYHDVRPIRAEDHEVIDPIEELKRMRPDVEVIVINIEEYSEPAEDRIDWKAGGS